MDLFGYRCRCEQCSDKPLPTYTRKFMRECEIRALVAMPTNADRRRYIEAVEKRRGHNAAVRLREQVWTQIKELM